MTRAVCVGGEWDGHEIGDPAPEFPGIWVVMPPILKGTGEPRRYERYVVTNQTDDLGRRLLVHTP